MGKHIKVVHINVKGTCCDDYMYGANNAPNNNIADDNNTNSSNTNSNNWRPFEKQHEDSSESEDDEIVKNIGKLEYSEITSGLETQTISLEQQLEKEINNSVAFSTNTNDANN